MMKRHRRHCESERELRPLRSTLTRRLLGWAFLLILTQTLLTTLGVHEVMLRIAAHHEEASWLIHWRVLPVLTAGASCLAVIPLVVFAARRWTRPIRRMIAAAQRLTAGQTPPPVPVVGASELAQLAEAFNTMARSWQATRQQLQHANRELEHRVAQRTAELMVSNRRLAEAVRQLESIAATDPLTGLANRRAIDQAILAVFDDARRRGRDLACLMIDLDGFKQLNDTKGHASGDDLLARCGEVLDSVCREGDIAGRLGGDEFIILLPGADLRDAERIAHRVRAQFRDQARRIDPASFAARPVTMSIGVASLQTSDAANPQQLLAIADDALYQAKRAGRDRIVLARDDGRAADRAAA